MLAQWGRVNADERSDLRTSSARVLVEAARTHLSQDLHAGGEVLACRWVSQCVLTHKGNHRVEGGHTHVLHRRQFLRLVQIHDGAAIKEREGKEWGKKSTWQPRYLFSDQYSDREINHVFSYWRDKILSVDGSLSQALWWRGHGVCLKLLDVSPQCCDLGLNCLLSLNTLALCPQEEGQKTIYTYWILLFIYFKLQTSGFNASFFFAILWQWGWRVPGMAVLLSPCTQGPWWPALAGSCTAGEDSQAAPALSPPAGPHVQLQS